jgi:predicted regulator of amino acid metabolism with ACT domain
MDAREAAVKAIEIREEQLARVHGADPKEVIRVRKGFAAARKLLTQGEYLKAINKAKAAWAKFMDYAVKAGLV